MHFDSVNSLIHMDGHGLYVWSSYGIGLLVIAYNVLSPILKLRQVTRMIIRQCRLSRVENEGQADVMSMDRGEVV